jgi:2-hydroxychromene-2-carboxylate isomerase
MKEITFWFDPLSPFVHLAFHRLPEALAGTSHVVHYRPVLLAALLQHHGQKGPAEVEPKRAFTLRHVHWLAQHHGIALHTPRRHPFNPLALLRLALACAPAGGLPNRWVVENVLAHVWCSDGEPGADAEDPERLRALAERLQPQRDPASDAVKAELRAHTDAAREAGVFGVPAFVTDGRLFWGLDSLPMLRDALNDHPWFQGPTWEAEGAPREGVRRV